MPDDLIPPTLRLQTNAVSPEFPAPSLSPSFKLDEGYSDETRSQAEKDLGSDNVMTLPNWVLAQSEAGRAGRIFLFLRIVCLIDCEALRLLTLFRYLFPC